MTRFLSPFVDRAGRFSALKTVTFAGLAAPAVWLLYRALTHDLGPLAVKEALLVMGLWAVRLLLLSLALTPAMRIFAWPKLALVRRMTGIAAFAYAAAHLGLYVVMQKYDLARVASEIALRIYLTIGFAALLGLAALAATSTDAMVRRLGGRWKQLHKLVYAIAALGVLHFFLQSKIDVTEATLMAGFFATLMLYRVMIARRMQPGLAVLSGVALLGAAATAGIEAAWYGLTTGVDPQGVLMANVSLAMGLRPAVIVALSGLAVAVVQSGLRLTRKPRPALRARTA